MVSIWGLGRSSRIHRDLAATHPRDEEGLGEMVDVRILGPLEVRAGGTELSLGGTRQRAVLAMLALRVNQVVSTEL